MPSFASFGQPDTRSVWERAADLLDPPPVVVPDPVEWVHSVLGEETWSVQEDVLRSVVTHRKTCVASGHGLGKSWLASRAAAWWIASHPPGEAKVVTSAPSQDQVRKILWNEIRQAHGKGSLPGRISMGQIPEWSIDGDIVAFGRKGADRLDANQARTMFQGIHARYLLVILDECCGIPEWLWDATMSLTTGEDGRVLAIGNPDDPATRFAKNCAPGSDWHVMHVSVFDAPAFTGEPVSDYLRASLVGPQYVEDAEREWGVENPLYISKVLGQFPEVSDDVIITPRMVRLAQERDLSGNAIGAKRRWGMDVAAEGADETCIYEYRGGPLRLVDAWRKQDTHVSRKRLQNLLDEPVNRYVPVTIDVVGLGHGVHDPLKNKGYRVRRFNGGEAAYDPERFVNRNAESWWALREGFEAGLIDLDPADLKLAAQLQSRRWKPDASQRRTAVESKVKMKERGIPSPDRADGAVMAYYELRTVDDPDRILEPALGESGLSITGDLLTLPT